MNINNIKEKFKNLHEINASDVESLYTLSIRSLSVVLLLAVAITFALYPILKYKILIWFIPLCALLIYRLYCANIYKKNPKKYSVQKWYRKFVFFAILTAILYSSVGFIYIHMVDSYHQLFILSIMVGLSSGAAFALSPDVRLSISYLSILIVSIALIFPLTTFCDGV